MDLLIPIVVGVLALVVGLGLFLAFAWRRVVPTNMVYIVQSSRKTTSYGTGLPHGNVFYEIPSFIPMFGVLVRKLPTSNFDIPLPNYEGYDKDRLPFLLDLIGFFVIDDTNKAAQKAESFDKLKEQLKDVMRGAARAVLGQHDIHEIMIDRATFGKKFTDEVDNGLKEWGVRTIKNLELMDVRDVQGSHVIANIMAKKSSEIERDSRMVVAENKKQADIAVIEAEREVELQEQQKLQAVGERTATQEQAVGIAREKATQEVQAEAKTTMQRKMEVVAVETQRKAEIARDAAIVEAEQVKQTDIIFADGEKQKTILTAEGVLEQEKRKAEGIQVNGVAAADAQRLMLLAPVEAQITLAEKIAALPEYQAYLVQIEQVKAAQAVGIANAGALEAANIKIIANSGDASTGIASIGDLLGSKGGVAFGALLEGFANTPQGAAALARLGVNTNEGGKTDAA